MAFEMNVREISREVIAEGHTEKVRCKNYQNTVSGLRQLTTTNYVSARPVKFELYRVVREYRPEYTSAQTFEFWFLYIDGKFLNVGEITSFRKLGTIIELECHVKAH